MLYFYMYVFTLFSEKVYEHLCKGGYDGNEGIGIFYSSRDEDEVLEANMVVLILFFRNKEFRALTKSFKAIIKK